jgi:hypothetical protein
VKSLNSLIVKYAVILLMISISDILRNLLPIFIGSEVYTVSQLFTFGKILSYIINIVASIFLIFDLKKYKINNFLIPVLAVFFPIAGVALFLILFVLEGRKTEKI